MASKKAEDREPLPGAVKKRGDATEAGGGNLHRGREPLPGAVKKRGEATKAGGGNLQRGRGATA